MEEEEVGRVWPPPAALQASGMPLSLFMLVLKGFFPTSPLCMILLNLFISDVRLSEQKESRKEETTENTSHKMEGHGD